MAQPDDADADDDLFDDDPDGPEDPGERVS